jgi:hypothetical protein
LLALAAIVLANKVSKETCVNGSHAQMMLTVTATANPVATARIAAVLAHQHGLVSHVSGRSAQPQRTATTMEFPMAISPASVGGLQPATAPVMRAGTEISVSCSFAPERRIAQIRENHLEISPTAPVLAIKATSVTSVIWCFVPTRKTATHMVLPTEPEKRAAHACVIRDGKEQNVTKSCVLRRKTALPEATSPVSVPTATVNALPDSWVSSVKR